MGLDPVAHRAVPVGLVLRGLPGVVGARAGLPAQRGHRRPPHLRDARRRWPALEAGDPGAAARILLAHAIVCSFGGLPVVWMGDELGLLNDRGWADDPAHADDNRWVHRPRMPWDLVADGADPAGIGSGLRHLLDVRAGLPQLHAATPTEVWDPRDPRRAARRAPAPGRAAAGRRTTSPARRRGSPPTSCCGSGWTRPPSATRSPARHRSVHDGAVRLAPYAAAWLHATP